MRESRCQGTTSGSKGAGQEYFLVEKFKLLLAGKGQALADSQLPDGLTAKGVISDYLRKIADFILVVLRGKFGEHVQRSEIQWCLTVPALWEERAKQDMKKCAELAGLVHGPSCTDRHASPHPLVIVLEPEAASMYCQEQKNAGRLRDGDKFMVVDIGGGTTDLVLHQKVGSARKLTVKEIAPSSGGLCGGTFVDQAFKYFVLRKIKCLERISLEQPRLLLELMGSWEELKSEFDGETQFGYTVDIPAGLATEWEADEGSTTASSVDDSPSYDTLELSLQDMVLIFSPAVKKILKLIQSKMVEGLKMMMVVGGFSESPYLVKKIREAFSTKVGSILIPNEPGSAVCSGAVTYCMYGTNVIQSRIAKKTYGVESSRPFMPGDPMHLMIPNLLLDIPMCGSVFEIYVRAGDDLPLDHCVTTVFSPVLPFQEQMKVRLLSSTSKSDPKYVKDEGVEKLGKFIIKHPSALELGDLPKIKVSMYFGRSMIEMKAEGENFGQGQTFVMPPVAFDNE